MLAGTLLSLLLSSSIPLLLSLCFAPTVLEWSIRTIETNVLSCSTCTFISLFSLSLVNYETDASTRLVSFASFVSCDFLAFVYQIQFDSLGSANGWHFLSVGGKTYGKRSYVCLWISRLWQKRPCLNTCDKKNPTSTVVAWANATGYAIAELDRVVEGLYESLSFFLIYTTHWIFLRMMETFLLEGSIEIGVIAIA